MSLEGLKECISNERLDPQSHLEWAASEIEQLHSQLREARSIIDGLRFHDMSGRADKFMGDSPFSRSS